MSVDTQDILDNLDLLETSLLEYERILKNREDNQSLIHVLFRYAHNTKGALSILGAEDAAQLIHAVETGFDHVRNGLLSMTAEYVDVSLRSITGIRDNLEGEDNAELLAALREEAVALYSGSVDGEKIVSAGLPFPLNEEQQATLDSVLADGQNIFVIEKLVTGDISEEAFATLPIYADVEDCGTLIASHPNYQELPKGQNEALLQLLFASEQSADDLELCIFDPFKPINLASPSVIEEEPYVPVEREGYRILIVEDDALNRKVLTEFLKPYGEIDIAVDGRDGLVLFLLALEERDPYQIICLDIMMPLMDGQALLKHIRRCEEERDIKIRDSAKIIMTTALGDKDNVLGAFREGCEGYIVKPVERAELHKLIKKLGFEEKA